jgi:hypothetical protein
MLLNSNVFADTNISLSYKTVIAATSYTVTKDSIKAKLDFPYKVNSATLALTKELYSYKLFTELEMMTSFKKTKGEDFDWYQGEMSVYSYSSQSVEDFASITLGVNKQYCEYFSMTYLYKFHQQKFIWSAVHQYDYINNSSITVEDASIQYEQFIHTLKLKPTASYHFNKFQLSYTPSINYIQMSSTDKHLLRGFYTIQENSGFLLEQNFSLIYSHNRNIAFALYYSTESFHDKNSYMNYYFNSGYKYDKLQSTLNYEQTSYALTFFYTF